MDENIIKQEKLIEENAWADDVNHKFVIIY